MIGVNKFFGKKICVAVSGGIDSMTLLHYLTAKQAEGGYQLSVVHCEHGIRGEESVADGRFVQEICEKLGLRCFFYSADCPRLAQERKMSVETAARMFRRDCFRELLNSGKADLIATAHHQGDEAETVLFRIARGSSLTGARGMAEEANGMIRPLLDWTRKEIEIYAMEHGVIYREDRTNANTEYTRNKIRMEVLPKLEEAVPGAAANLARFAMLAAEDDRLLYELSEKLLSQIDAETWKVNFCEKRPLFMRACLAAIKALGLEKDYTTAHLEAVYRLQTSERGAMAILPRNIQAEKQTDGIVFYRKRDRENEPCGEEKKFSEEGYDGGRYAVKVFVSPPNDCLHEEKILRIDADKLPKDAVFRFRREGDVITRFGGGTKTLKKFFNEQKTPVDERAYLPLIAEENGKEVYVVCGAEISEKVKVTPQTQRIFYIKTQKKKGE